MIHILLAGIRCPESEFFPYQKNGEIQIPRKQKSSSVS